MANLNRVVLIGNLTREPTIKYTPEGVAILQMTVAVNRNEQDGGCDYIRVAVRGKMAESCSDHLGKGSPVAIDGKIRQESWSENGKTVRKTGVLANWVQFLGAPKSRVDIRAMNQVENARRAQERTVEEEFDDDVPF